MENPNINIFELIDPKILNKLSQYHLSIKSKKSINFL